MQIREYRESDLDALRRIHAAQNFPYEFPDLTNPLFLTKIVLTDGDSENGVPGFAPASSSLTVNGERPTVNPTPCGEASGENAVLKGGATTTSDRILGAALLRLTAEAYLLLDPRHGSPRQRWQALLALHAAAQHDAAARGLEDVHAWLPPRVANTFGRRLQRLGWLRDDSWTPYCKRFSL